MDRTRLLAAIAAIGGAALLTGVVLAGASQATLPADAGPRGGPPPGAGLMVPGMISQGAFERAARELGLTAEQRQSIKEFFDQGRPGLEQLRRQMRANAELLAKTRPDDPSFTSVVANVSESSGEIASQAVLKGSQLRSQVFGVLSSDQKTKLVALELEQRDSRIKDAAARQHGAAPGAGPQ
ncbi:MAG TPA: Spy/CpxP family protein refolding chaperone [Steroidobacteraceae bacterium]|nr:Spy/CpxP family protein refolding chaperone [Steroidobacteraceae bacterium]